MNKQDFIAALQDTPAGKGFSKNTLADLLDALGEVAAGELANGGEVTLPGLGKLSVKERAARTGRNPATGEELQIPAKRVAAFSPAKALKDALS